MKIQFQVMLTYPLSSVFTQITYFQIRVKFDKDHLNYEYDV